MVISKAHTDNDPALMAGQMLLRLGIALFAIGIPCGAVISRRLLFVVMPVAAVLVIMGSLLLPGAPARIMRNVRVALAKPLIMIPLFMIVWAGASFLWTPLPGLAVERFLKSAGTVLVAAVAIAGLPDRIKASNSNLLPVGVAAAALATVAVGLFSPQALRAVDAEGNTLQRAVLGLVVMMWPALAALALRERVAAAGMVAVGVAVASILVWMPAALTALIIGILVFSLSYAAPERAGLVLGLVAAVLMITAPALALILDPFAARADPSGLLGGVHVWAQIVKSEGLRLVTGHGFDTVVRAMTAGIIPVRAPRGILFEVWYELGVVGAAAMAALFWSAFTAASRVGRAIAPFLLAALAGVVTISIAGVSVSQLWWTTQLASVALVFAVVLRAQARSERVQVRVLKERPVLRI